MSSKRILDMIHSPADLHLLDIDELGILAQEIRDEIIEVTSNNGGHVASSLGAVEIILALHSLIDAPKDKVVFDVGHQSYAHKLVTGRVEDFETLRLFGGLSGFPRPSESPYDSHPSGHASDSLSVASGFAKARLLNGTDEKIVAIIGDAALAGGMAFEALNYIGSQQLPMVIILNDNEMSISRNVGALMKHLGNIRATRQYRTFRENVQEQLESGGWVSNAFAEFGKRTKESFKQMIIPQAMLYEQLGIVCTPPIDGHDLHELRDMLEMVLPMDVPVLMHVVTKKGAGYSFAENDPERFHGIAPYDPATAQLKRTDFAAPTFTEVFGNALCEEAERDERIVAITAAMAGGTGLKGFAERFPDRFIDVGIAEEHAVGMACGLASAGKKPVVALYSTFAQRAFDQIAIDVALPDLDVVFALDRAGLVGDDGPTHHGVFDIAYMRMIPQMRVITPSNEKMLVDALKTALALKGPVSVRYPRGHGYGVALDDPSLLEVGVSREVRQGDDIAILAFGRMVNDALAVANELEADGLSVRVVDMIWAKPLDAEAIRRACDTRLVVTIEEGVISGGAGEGVLEVMQEIGSVCNALTLGIPDRFIMQGSCPLLFKEMGLDVPSISARIRKELSR